MAVVLRGVSSFGRVASTWSGGACARVCCGIESTRVSKPNGNSSFFNDQESSFSKSKNGTAGGFSPLAVAATRQSIGVLERPLEVEKVLPEARPETIDQHAEPLRRSFLAESVNGNLVECCSRGSRPLYTNVLTEFQLTYTGTSSQSDVVDQSGVNAAFLAALASSPDDARLVSEYAMFTWKSLNDVDGAEELYNKALELAPHDVNIQASHAQFLWQCDE